MAEKRFSTFLGLIQSSKRSKLEDGDRVFGGLRRTSGLPDRIIRMENHEGTINSVKFHPLGQHLMSAGYDKKINLRCVYGYHGNNIALEGHRGPIMEVNFSIDGSAIYSGSMDQTVAIWDTTTGTLINFLQGHKGDVNTVQSNKFSDTLLCSGSNDGTVRLWDTREPLAVQVFSSGFQVLTSCFSLLGDLVISAGVDNCINIWDLRKNKIVAVLIGHMDLITGLALSPCGTKLLSTSIDSSLRIWNMKPFKNWDESIDSFPSYQSLTEPNLLKCAWSRDGKRISSGSSNHRVNIWDVNSHLKAYALEGHDNSIIDVDFHPVEPIIASGSCHEDLYMHELWN